MITGFQGRLLLGVVPLSVALYFIRCISRKPELSPSEFKNKKKETRKPVIVCLGDSNTHGVVAAPWLEQVRRQYGGWDVVNAGLNSHTAWRMEQRLQRDVLDLKPDAVLVLAGTNDAIGISMPRTFGWTYGKYVQGMVPSWRPTRELFRESIGAILHRLRDAGIPYRAIMTIPMIEETSRKSMLNEVVGEVNHMIQVAATTTDTPVLDLNKKMWEAIENELPDRDERPPSMLARIASMGSAPVLHYILRQDWDGIGDLWGNHFTTDSIHLNGRAAHIVSDLVARWLREIRL